MTATTVHVPERRSRPSAPDGRETIRSHRSATTRGTGTVGRGPVPGLRVQRLPRVTAATDASELEADAAARRIASGGVAGPITTTEGAAGTGVGAGRMAVGDEDRSVRAWLQRVVVGEDDDVVARALVGEDEGVLSRTTDRSTTATTVGTVTGATPRSEATIRNPGAGAPLSGSVRHRIEPGLGVGLGHVRVHTGSAAAEAAQSLQARAFTHGHDIFLGRDESPTDLSLMAHEATHVVQQRAAEPHVQRLAGFIRNELADLARHVPGYTFVTVVIGYDPVRGTRVERTGRALVQGFLELVPFGAVIFDRLDRMGIVDDVVGFVEARLRERDLSLARLERTIERAWDRMDFLRLDPFAFNLGVLRDEFGALWDDVVGFATSIVDGVMAFVKDAAIGLAADLLEERPTWVLFTKVIHHDPLRDEPVEPTIEEIITDFLVLIGRERELEQMRARGTLARTAAWLDTQLATFRGLIGRATALFAAAWEAIRPSNLANLIDDLRGLANRAIDLLTDVASFAATVAAQVLAYIKDALLAWLSSFAHEVPGFHLMTVLVGRDPFTGATVLRTPENLIRGFITLLPGGNAVYDRLAETGIVGEAAARIQGAVDALGISWELVTGIFRGIWDALGIEDLIDPIGAFTRIRDRFGEPIARLFAFVRVVVQEVLTLLLAAMRFPVDLIGSIISNAMQAFGDIRRDVVGFLINLLAGFRAGFTAFFANIAQHLLGGLVDWLFRGLRSAGIEPPTELSFRAILDLVMQVLGLTADFLWRKLGERIGPERVEQVRAAIDRLTGVWAFVREVSVRGPIAIWEYVQERLSGLWDLILDRARNWIVETIIGRATARLLSMLDPTGLMAVVNGFIAFFDAVKSAIEYLRDILAIVNEWTSTIAAVARGEIQAGAAKLEAALAQAIPVAIGFLAQQVGLGNVGEKLSEIIAGVRGLVERAIDWLLDRAMAAFQSILGALGLGGGPGEAEDAAEEPATGTWLVERSEGGHTIRIDDRLRVVRFSDPTTLTGEDALAELQQTLDGLVTRVAPDFTVVDGLGRATGPSGHVASVKAEEGRSASMPSVSALGGHSVYEPGDQRGHLIGDRFHGPATAGNLVPMHPVLNLSTFKRYENQVARAYLDLRSQNKPALVHMAVTPDYPSTGNVGRPTSVSAVSEVITLTAGAGGLTTTTTSLSSGALDNPSDLGTDVNILTASETALRAVLRPITPHTNELIGWIVRVRHPSMDPDSFQLALAVALGDRAFLIEEVLVPRADRLVI
jgi:hypothetical protein